MDTKHELSAPRVASEASGPDNQFRAFLAEGRFMLQRCRLDGKFLFYPRVLCPHCGSKDLEWAEASGEGCVCRKSDSAILMVKAAKDRS
jgi:uncharacterized OB-fold protein